MHHLLGLILLTLTIAHNSAAAAISIDEDTQPIDRSIPGISYAPVLEQATQAVVGIATTDFVAEGAGGDDTRSRMEEFLRRYYGLPESDSPRNSDEGEAPERERRRSTGAGSGVIVSSDGYIVTNHHVVMNRMEELVDEVLVTLSDGREYVAEVIGTDKRTDVGILKIEASDLPTITINTAEDLRVGDIVFAIGNPLDTGIAVTQGIISATGRQNYGVLGSGGYENFIQTDASINMGNSGGPLVDAYGRMIGINTAIISSTGGNIGIGLAIPSKIVLGIANNLADSGEVSRGFLGVLPEDLSLTLAESFGLKDANGALIARVTDASPAAEVGILRGDVILEVNNDKILNAADLRLKVSFYSPGTTVQLLILRDGKRFTQPIELGDLDKAIAQMNSGRTLPNFEKESIPSPLEGITLVALDASELAEMDIVDFDSGILVEQVSVDSPYARQLQAGMVILEWNRKPAASVQAIESALREGVNRLYVFNDGAYSYLALRKQD